MSFFGKIFSALSLHPKVFDEDEKKIVASYLRIFLIVSIILLPLYVLVKIFGEGFLPSSFINFGLALFCGFLLYLLNKGKLVLSGTLFLLFSWVAMTAMACYADGVQDMAIVAYILIIFLATLISGIRFAFSITALSIISVWALGILQLHNVIIPTGDKPLNYSRDYTIIFAMVLTAIILLSRSFRHSLDRVNWELKERIKAEENLSRNEQSLLEKNAELIIAKNKAEESDRLKTAFIQNISHEIRTPMNGIVGFTDLLQHPDTDSVKRNEYLSIINTCTQQLASLVNDLIDISKLETGTVELNISESSLDQVISDITHDVSKSVKEKSLRFNITNNLGSYYIRTDHGKIKQILENLVDNAVKFTPKGDVSIFLSKSGENILVSVSDTGIGIKESDKMVIFDRFRQAEVGLNRSYGGSGLGLAISKGLVELLGGEIWFESESGRGSIFSFSIPVEFLRTLEAIEHAAPEISSIPRLKILAAEDDEINYLYLKELLADSGSNIIWARDGNEAIEIFKSSVDFDVVLMDLKMPVMNGYEAASEIKKINPKIPVIAVTAFGYQEEVERTTKAGFNGYILKPIEKNDLLAKISRVLS